MMKKSAQKECLWLQLNERSITSCWVCKFARVVVLGKYKIKLFQKLIETYTEAHKDKNGNDLQLEVSTDWKEVKKLKDSDLEVAVNNKISELKKLSTNKKV